MNRLHPEVITLCAAFVSDTDPKPIIPLTHVCRYWRRTIISSPRSWASIGSGWKQLAPLCFERAGAIPLVVNISALDIKGDNSFLQALVPHTSRISHLSLTRYSSIEEVADGPPSFFAAPMPNLTSLELEQVKEPTESIQSNETLAHPLFQNVSKFKSLHLTRTPLYPGAFSTTSLVDLKLVGHTIPFGKFIGFLHSNPNLKLVVLDLRFAGGSVCVSPEKQAPLPRLRRLSFTCRSAADARGLLSCVSLRRGVQIAIQGSQSNLCADLASFLPCPPTPIQQLFTPITVIKYQTAPRWLHIASSDGQFSFQSPQAPSTTFDEFNLFVTGAVREFHLGICHRRTNYHSGYVSSPWGRLPALEALVMSGTHMPSGSLPALTRGPTLCPSLKSIAFFDCQVAGTEVVRELNEMQAKRRNSAAAQLYRVMIVNNTLALPDIRLIHQLRKFIPRVDIGVGNKVPDLL